MKLDSDKAFEKCLKRTQFQIKTDGPHHVNIKVQGYQIGVVYKMAYVLTELVRMGTLEIMDLAEIFKIAAQYIEENKAIFKKKKKQKFNPMKKPVIKTIEIDEPISSPEELIEKLEKLVAENPELQQVIDRIQDDIENGRFEENEDD